MSTVKLTWHGAAILKRLEQAQQNGIDKTTADCVNHSMALTNRSAGGGRTYRKGASRVFYQASAPGEAPVRVTGILQGNIKMQAATKQGGKIVGLWGAGQGGLAGGGSPGYALYLEVGTAHIAKRPYLRPSAEIQYPLLAGRIQKFFAKGGPA